MPKIHPDPLWWSGSENNSIFVSFSPENGRTDHFRDENPCRKKFGLRYCIYIKWRVAWLSFHRVVSPGKIDNPWKWSQLCVKGTFNFMNAQNWIWMCGKKLLQFLWPPDRPKIESSCFRPTFRPEIERFDPQNMRHLERFVRRAFKWHLNHGDTAFPEKALLSGTYTNVTRNAQNPPGPIVMVGKWK